METKDYIRSLELSGQLSKSVLRETIQTLNIKSGTEILDIPCGIGNHISLFIENNQNIKITGADIAVPMLDFARNKFQEREISGSWSFVEADLNNMFFADNSFDLIWCSDGLWPGPEEMGYPAETPYKIIDEMIRVTRNNGTIVILFWTSQKLLPGYPFLEAALNAAAAANLPKSSAKGELHFMKTHKWLKMAGLKDIKIKTFTGDIHPPQTQSEKEALKFVMNMLWEDVLHKVDSKNRDLFQKLITPESKEYIINDPDYYGFFTYTMFSGKVSTPSCKAEF